MPRKGKNKHQPTKEEKSSSTKGDPAEQPQQQEQHGSQQHPRQTGPPQQASQGQAQQPQQQEQRGAWQQPRQSGPPQQGSPGQAQQPQQEQRGSQQQPRQAGSQQQGFQGQAQQPRQQEQRGTWQQPKQSGPPQQGFQGHAQQPRQQKQRGAWRQPGQTGPPQQGSQGQAQQPQQQEQRGAWRQPGQTGPPQQGSQGQAQQPQQQEQRGSQQQPRQTGPPQQGSQGQAQQPRQQEQKGVPQAAQSKKVTLSSAMQQSYVAEIPKRHNKSGGQQGIKIVVGTNMFRLLFNPQFITNATHYDVVITPDRPKYLMRPAFEAYRQKHFPKRYPAFDGRRNAYSANDLPFGPISIEDEVNVYNTEQQREVTFKVYLQKVASIDLSWLKTQNLDELSNLIEQNAIQALDIIMRHDAASRYVSVGRSLFYPPPPGRVVSLGSGIDLWKGVFQSAVVGWRPYLNFDVSHKGFPKPQSVIDLIKDLCANPRSNEPLAIVRPENVQRNEWKINKFLKGLKIKIEIPGQPLSRRVYRASGLSICPRKNMFKRDDETMCSVENYFLEVKKYKLQYPELPCLRVTLKSKDIHFPMELCSIVEGQSTQRKLDENQTANMVRATVTNSRERKDKIMEAFSKMNINRQPAMANEFHLSVQGEFEQVPARILQPPGIKYDRANVNVVKGVWRPGSFLKSSQLPDNTWTILNLDRYVKDRDLYESLHDKLRDGGKFVNMVIGKAETPFTTLLIQGGNITPILRYFEEKKRRNIKLVVVVLPLQDKAYSQVKQICELKITGGIVTQCIKSATLRKMRDATVSNILLKINSKLNGVNHTFVQRPPCLNVPCMIVGADVTHPSPDATDIPSIAAVAASHDPNAFKYNIELRLQPPREEMIQDLEEIMQNQLLYFYRATGYKPRKLIFYRDGVSDGQLAQVMHYELSAIRRAISKLEKDGDQKIAITFLVVQKRHHVRFFPTDGRNCDQKNFNVLAGTVVDTEITHPTHVDFYLVSHASIQGTARPTKYRCLCNESNKSEDEIEQLTYYLCHMFARCTRSVSYPAPTYYAHLAAFRARTLIDGVPLNLHNLQEEQRSKMALQLSVDSPMFFV